MSIAAGRQGAEPPERRGPVRRHRLRSRCGGTVVQQAQGRGAASRRRRLSSRRRKTERRDAAVGDAGRRQEPDDHAREVLRAAAGRGSGRLCDAAAREWRCTASSCPNVPVFRQNEPERLVEINWTESDGERYQADIRIKALDRVGMLNDITAIFSEAKTNITGARLSRCRTRPRTST